MSAGLKGTWATVSENGSAVLLKKGDKVLETLPLKPARIQDRNYILGTWVKSGQHNPAIRNGVDRITWVREENVIAELNWDRALVVTDPTDDFAVHGWVCAGPGGTLLHVYVPPELRRIGLGTALIKHVCGTDVMSGRKWPFLGRPKGLKWTYNPYVLTQRAS